MEISDLTSFVGLTIDVSTWQALRAECDRRHGSAWQFITYQTAQGVYITRLIINPAATATGDPAGAMELTMPFQKMQTQLPPRQWALVGYPGSGKSTFAASMLAPMVVIDADHRFSEVLRHVAGDVFSLSEDASDNSDAERIATLLKLNMKDSGVKTIVVDSLTAIIAPLVSAAVLDNDAGRNKNFAAAFKSKAMAMRLLQDTITGYGVDTLWVYHLRSGRNEKGQVKESTSISVVELARLRRSLNLQLRVVEAADRRGVVVDWARCGRSDLTLWDDTGCWRGMPERIEQAVYAGLTIEEMQGIADRTPSSFANAAAAIAWGFEQGAFKDAVHAQNAYEELKRDQTPKTAAGMWSLWIADVEERLASGQESLT